VSEGSERRYRSGIDPETPLEEPTSRRDARHLGAGAIIGVLGGTTSFVITTVYQVVVARTIGPAGFGIFSLALAIASFLAEGGDLGLDYGVLRFGGIAVRTDDRGVFRSIIRRALTGSLTIGAVSGVALAIASGFGAKLFDKPDLTMPLAALALTVPFTASTEIARAGLRALGRAGRPVAVAGIFGPGLRLIASIVALTIAPTAAAAAWAYLAAEVLLFVISAFMLWQLLPPSDGSSFPAGRLYRFSAPMSLNRLLLYSNNQTETFFLGFLASSATLGIFGIARRLSQIVGSALLAAVAVLFDPIVAGLHHTQRIDDLDQLFKTSTRWLFTLGLPVSLVEILFANDIMRIFGHGFASGGLALAILTAGQLINVGTGISANLQAMAGYTGVTLLNAAMFIALSLLFDALLIPPFGLLGAAIANSGAVVSINLVRLVQIKRRLGISPYDRKFLRPIVAAVPAAVVAWFVPVPFGDALAEVLARAVLLGAVYFAVLMMLGIDPVDREILSGAVRRLRTRTPRSRPNGPTRMDVAAADMARVGTEDGPSR